MGCLQLRPSTNVQHGNAKHLTVGHRVNMWSSLITHKSATTFALTSALLCKLRPAKVDPTMHLSIQATAIRCKQCNCILPEIMNYEDIVATEAKQDRKEADATHRKSSRRKTTKETPIKPQSKSSCEVDLKAARCQIAAAGLLEYCSRSVFRMIPDSRLLIKQSVELLFLAPSSPGLTSDVYQTPVPHVKPSIQGKQESATSSKSNQSGDCESV